jgi:hypothetical protein
MRGAPAAGTLFRCKACLQADAARDRELAKAKVGQPATTKLCRTCSSPRRIVLAMMTS